MNCSRDPFGRSLISNLVNESSSVNSLSQVNIQTWDFVARASHQLWGPMLPEAYRNGHRVSLRISWTIAAD